MKKGNEKKKTPAPSGTTRRVPGETPRSESVAFKKLKKK
jgi:hypothetical protein